MKTFLIAMSAAFRGIHRDLFRFRGSEARGDFWTKSLLNLLLLLVTIGPLLVVNYHTADLLPRPIMSHLAVQLAALVMILTVLIGLNLPLMVRRLRDVRLPAGAYMTIGAATLACWIIPGLEAYGGVPMNILVLVGCFAPAAWGRRFTATTRKPNGCH
ncbi:DUF805 domain-containing protein [Paracoccus sp. ME4]|uniref:DUF805 domain-containing protein n=1 Tax=Paracoccus sp. ME4 TaxID=3138066 RepID=UPI00398AB30F